MPAKEIPESIPVYQLKVTLHDIRPPIWRRIQVSGNITLLKLHKILQVLMGWADYHLHLFTVGDVIFAVPSPDDPWPMETRNEKRARLYQVAPVEQFKFDYEYDLGDSWHHEILVEKIFHPENELRHAVCIKGKRSAPPEDCGGIGGYCYFLKAIQDPKHPDHERLLEWAGREFDPESFDIDEINRFLVKIR